MCCCHGRRCHSRTAAATTARRLSQRHGGRYNGKAAVTNAWQTKLTVNNNKYEVNSKFYFYSPFHFYLPFHVLLSRLPLSQRHGGRHRGTAAVTEARQTKLTANNNKYEVNSKFYFYSTFYFYSP